MIKWKGKEISFTYFILLINIAVFFIGGASITGKYALSLFDVVLKGQYYRIFTAMFLHADFMHLLNNCVTCLFLGMMVEKMEGFFPCLCIYLLSGIGGNVASLLYKYKHEPYVLSIGASGAVFGLMGFCLAAVVLDRVRSQTTVRQVMFAIILSFYAGVSSQKIDNAAHAGGLLTGFLLGAGYIVIRNIVTKRKADRQIGQWR